MLQQNLNEKGTTLIEVLIAAIILIIAGVGLFILLTNGLANNTKMSIMNNNILANYSVLANALPASTATVFVSVTDSAGSSQVPVSVAVSSITGNSDAIYQTE